MDKKPTKASKRLAELVQPLPRRFTVAEIARKLGVSRQTVTSWYSGENRPSVQHAGALEEITGIPTQDWRESE